MIVGHAYFVGKTTGVNGFGATVVVHVYSTEPPQPPAAAIHAAKRKMAPLDQKLASLRAKLGKRFEMIKQYDEATRRVEDCEREAREWSAYVKLLRAEGASR